MIFACDLDRTIIYSKNNLQALNEKEKEVIEYKNGLPLSYMSRNSLNLLQQIIQKMTFVPVTTRIMEQYSRINLGVYTVVPYAVISNGARILINGKDDAFWQKNVKDQLSDKCLNLESVLSHFCKFYAGEWVQSLRKAENLFIYCITKPECVPLSKMKEFEIWLNAHNWSLSIQGRKIYFIPDVIQKSSALDYLSRKIGKNLFAGAGDSFLDLSFLKQVQYPIVPRHGELYTRFKDILDKSKIRITSTSGVLAADELLSYILKL